MTNKHEKKSTAVLEHANVTVSDPDKTASLLCDLFGWEVRWTGPSLAGGYTVHVGEPGNGQSYLAVYTHDDTAGAMSADPYPAVSTTWGLSSTT
ncbi:MAG: hypothetical protein R2706_03655 [Acidimicrobiales bacterium]